MFERPKSDPVIAVSGLHRGESPQPGGAVIEGIRDVWPNARVVGISYDPMESGVFSQGPDRADRSYLFPFPGSGPDQLLGRLKEVHEQEQLSLIIPTLDSELANYALLRTELSAMGIAVVVPDAPALAARSKPALGVLGETAEVAVPRTHVADDIAELAAYALWIGYPCYVKGPLYDARLVHDETQLVAAFNAIASVWGTPVLVQQAVYGEEYGICAIGDGDGGVVGSVTIRKLLRTRMGKGFGGVTVANPEIDAITERLVGALKWDGPLEIELVRPVGGDCVLFEINPRFPAWVSFPSRIGLNMPAWVAAKALGLERPDLEPLGPGHVFLRHCEDIATHIDCIADLVIDGALGAPAREAVPELVKSRGRRS